MKYGSALKAKLIYVFRINDEAHRGCLKIGDATLNECTRLDLQPNCRELNQAAKQRINQYTQTASINYELLHTEITFYVAGGTIGSFTDGAVHEVLLRSGIKRHDFSSENQGREWFECDLETVKHAIKAVKEGRSALEGHEVTEDRNPIIFRPEQNDAIRKTVKKFHTRGTHMLWNAKMRFGKTLSALQVVKECGFKRTLILTHRPVVDDSWFEDFNKIFYDENLQYSYGSKDNGHKFDELEKRCKHNEESNYVYFASMQDLRGSEQAGGKFDKNNEIFQTTWDCLIIDEAHEGTQTTLGQTVIDLLTKPSTCTLNLSGTPFNLLDDFNEDEVYTWDYVMEQQAKEQWDIDHFGDPNPYAGLPRMNIFTFDLGKIVSGYADVVDSAFNFKEFFRTWTGDPGRDHKTMPQNATIGKFIHEGDVKKFLDLIVKHDSKSNYPYSTQEYRENFRHSLWMVPGVREARALSELLKHHPVFGNFEIVNVAGDGDEETERNEALKMVRNAIGPNPEETYTITLSCGRLTAGVTVPPWTAVFMLAGSSKTDAKAYMQTIFRVQNPYTTRDGRRKEECFVFDFAPDRTLKVIAQVARVSTPRVQTESDKIAIGRFLNFCPIIGYDGTRMQTLNVGNMLEQLKRVYIERVVKHGFEDPYLYNDKLLKLTRVELEKFANLKKIIKTTKASHNTDSVDVNKQGFDNEQYEQVEKLKRDKRTRELTEEEKQLIEQYKEQQKQRASAISILRGISIRFPLLIYGCELSDNTQDVTIDNFSLLIDDDSWSEFMPKGVTKEMFREFTQYYDPEIFRASGRRIREMAKAADTLPPMERVQRIAEIFACFRNPDKETVLTPWRVVNMHMSDCLGGWDFMDDKHEKTLDVPRFVNQGEVTERVFRDPKTRILEINSKTGLYPLYVTYSVFCERCQQYRERHNITTDLPLDIQLKLWDKTLKENIFVICKTPMAQSITRRTLRGFRERTKVNAHAFDDLINQIKNKPKQFIERISNGKGFWKTNNEQNMKFNAIVGNPPYQVMDGGAGASSVPIYNRFVDISRKLLPLYISVIMPSRWMTGGRGLDTFRDTMLDDQHLQKLFDYFNARVCFSNVEIKGGICYFLWNKSHKAECEVHSFIGETESISERYLRDKGGDIFIRDNKLIELKNHIKSTNEETFDSMVSSMKPYGIRGDFFKDPSKYGLPAVKENKGDCPYTIIGLDEGLRRVKKYMPDNYPIPKTEMLNDYKIFITRNYGNGTIGELPASPIIAEPGMLCTETFVQIGPFSNEKQAKNCLSYMRTKLFRVLVGLRKQDQGAGKDVYAYVPIPSEGFNTPWTDAMLYKKYNLSDDEIAYIESLIKPME